MKRTTTASFVLELPLRVSPAEERKLAARLEAGRRLYNAVLGEALRRQRLIRESRCWRAARLLTREAGRAEAFRALCRAYRFTSAALSSFGSSCKNGARWQRMLGAHETQRIAERAFAAVEQYGFGNRGKPRFKGKGRPLHSIEGKCNAAGIRWHAETAAVEWLGLYLPALTAPAGKDPWQEAALVYPTKYCRIVWRMLNGRRRFYLQLVQQGTPLPKWETGKGELGLDLGPSVLALCGQQTAQMVALAPGVVQPWREMRVLQRKLDRSRRATNPERFNADGTWKKGERQQVFSARYRKVAAGLAETERRLAAERKRSHGELANDLLSIGKTAKIEKLSYRAWQRRFGRSSKVRGAGSFVSTLSRKAASAGGVLVELDARKLRLSQYDHPSGGYAKKPLSQRWHVLSDGSGIVQRDIYSALLAYCADGQGLHPSRIFEVWADRGPALRQAGWWREQPASGEARAFPTVKPSERVACRRRRSGGHGRDAVALPARGAREPGDPAGEAFGTPAL